MSERDYAEPLVRLKQLMAISPRDDWTQVQLGLAYGQLGHPEEALRYLGSEIIRGLSRSKGRSSCNARERFAEGGPQHRSEKGRNCSTR